MKSLAELKAIRDRVAPTLYIGEENDGMTRVVVGLATCGIASGARPVFEKMAEAVAENKLENVKVVRTGCVGICQYEPIVEVYEPGKEKVTYIRMTPEKAEEVVTKHLKEGAAVAEYTLVDTTL